MASAPQSESPKTEQIITEFFAKSLHIILESRSPSMSMSSSSVRPRDRWFNLALSECPAALENLDLWRQSNLDPMVVDIVFGSSSAEERIVERWMVGYERREKDEDPRKLSKRGGGGGGGVRSQTVYKKAIVLLRSLYLTVRTLPAYRLFRDISSSGRRHAFGLAHRVASFVQPFTRAEEADKHQFAFTPVETACGRLCISVLYSPVLSVVNVESSTTMSPEFIPDYVGSPLTNPLKRFHSIPRTGLHSQGLPSYPRMHSWSQSNSPNHMTNPLLRTESAPASVPAANPGIHRPPLSRVTKLESSLDTDNTKALTKVRDVPSDITTQKTNPLAKDVGTLSGAKLPSHNSLKVSCSRSFGRFSFQDDFDEYEFCPFALDDIDTTNTGIRTGSFDEKRHVRELLRHVRSLTVKKSQDAAVGSLVHILKTAPPLSQGFSNLKKLRASKPAVSNQTTEEPEHAKTEIGMVQNSTPKIGITSSGRLILKTTSQALEELKGYRDMKEKLLKHGCNVPRPVKPGGM